MKFRVRTRIRAALRGGLSFLFHVLRRVSRHNCLGMSAEIAFQMMFGLFQALLLIVAVLSILGADPEVFNSIVYFIGSFVPMELYSIIERQIREIAQAETTGIITFSLIGFTWVTTNLMFTLKKNFERSYRIKETRARWKVRLIALYISALATVSITMVLVLLLFGLQIARVIEYSFGYANILPFLIRTLRLPVSFVVTTAIAALLYYALLNVKERSWEVLPGALFFCVLWFILTYGFAHYLRNFPYFNRTYGTLGVFVALMIWMYLTALSILVGGEVNAEFYRRRRLRSISPRN